MSNDRCPVCNSAVEVHHGLEGTSHYRPVKDERLEAAEARARRAEEALGKAVAAADYAQDCHSCVSNGPDHLMAGLNEARSALATIPEGN